jgi:hypothetical protein
MFWRNLLRPPLGLNCVEHGTDSATQADFKEGESLIRMRVRKWNRPQHICLRYYMVSRSEQSPPCKPEGLYSHNLNCMFLEE